MHQLTNLARQDAALHLDERGRVTAIKAQAQRNARGLGGVNSLLRGGGGQRDGFFREHMLARARGFANVLAVQGMRRGDQHRVHRGVFQYIGVAGGQRQAVFVGGGAVFGRITRDAGDKFDLVAFALHRIDQARTPTSHAVNGDVQHTALPN